MEEKKIIQANRITSDYKGKGFNKFLFPILLAFFLVPILVHYVEVSPGMTGFDWFYSYEPLSDMSLYLRDVVFIGLGAVMLAGSVLLLTRSKRLSRRSGYMALADRTTKQAMLLWIPLAVYLIFVLISSIASENSSYAFSGVYGLYQSAPTILAYGIFAYYGYLCIMDERDVQTVLRAVYASMIIICLIGLSQFIGYDFFQTGLGETLILPSTLVGQNAISYHKEGNLVYTTLFNSNYVGTYVVVCAPVLAVSVVFAWKKLVIGRRYLKENPTLRLNSASGGNPVRKLRPELPNGKMYASAIGGVVLFASLMLCLLGSQSRTGIMIVGVLTIILLILFRKSIFKNKKAGLILIIGLVVLGAGGMFAANAASDGVLFSRIGSMFTGIFAETTADGQKKTGDYMITQIQTNQDDVVFEINQEKLSIQFDMQGDPENEHAFTVTDASGKELSYTREDSESSYYRIEDERFPELYLSMVDFQSVQAGYGFMVMTVEHRGDSTVPTSWYFSRENQDSDGGYYYCNQTNGAFVKIQETKGAKVFRDDFLNNRGYIWNQTLPMLDSYILLGCGANNFVFEFPNNDYLGLYNSGHAGEYIDKPHNMYLQTWMESGAVSLLAMLVFFILYLVQSLRLYAKRKLDEYLPAIGAAIFVGVLGYLMISMVNDSMVATAPVFWGILGVGMAVNSMCKNLETKGAV